MSVLNHQNEKEVNIPPGFQLIRKFILADVADSPELSLLVSINDGSR